MRAAAALFGLATLTSSSLEAQGCLRGAPLPKCRWFVLFEIGYSHRVNADTLAGGGSPQVHYLSGEVGWLHNVSTRVAVGGSFFSGALVDYAFQYRPGLKLRARYWLNAAQSLDVGAGPFLGRAQSASFDTDYTNVGVTSHVAFTVSPAFMVLAQLEVLSNPVDRRTSWYLGARLGDKPAAFTSAAAAVVLGGACALMCGRW
jgi:hypothetical protein